MKKGEFISVAKNMVTEYFNVFVDKEDLKISVNDICVVGFHDTPESYRIILSTPRSDDFFYEVVYDKNTKGLYSYAYRKVGKRIVGKRVTNRKGIK